MNLWPRGPTGEEEWEGIVRDESTAENVDTWETGSRILSSGWPWAQEVDPGPQKEPVKSKNPSWGVRGLVAAQMLVAHDHRGWPLQGVEYLMRPTSQRVFGELYVFDNREISSVKCI